MGTGDGGFSAGPTLDVGIWPWSVALGYVDQDSRLDLVVANFIGGYLSVILGNGDGTFAAEQQYSGDPRPRFVAIGDMDNDGDRDLLVANMNEDDVSILHNRAISADDCVRDPEWLCDGDVDGDGQVNPVDSGLVQAAFGSTNDQNLCNYNLDCDGQINPVDSGLVQSLFGTCEEPRNGCQ